MDFDTPNNVVALEASDALLVVEQAFRVDLTETRVKGLCIPISAT